jgi:hypothetical protein
MIAVFVGIGIWELILLSVCGLVVVGVIAIPVAIAVAASSRGPDKG